MRHLGEQWLILVSVSTWKNSVNPVIGKVGMFFSLRALKSINSIKIIQLKLMCALHLMATHSQQSSLDTVPPMPVMKRTTLPSTTSYLP